MIDVEMISDYESMPEMSEVYVVKKPSILASNQTLRYHENAIYFILNKAYNIRKIFSWPMIFKIVLGD